MHTNNRNRFNRLYLYTSVYTHTYGTLIIKAKGAYFVWRRYGSGRREESRGESDIILFQFKTYFKIIIKHRIYIYIYEFKQSGCALVNKAAPRRYRLLSEILVPGTGCLL